MKIVVDTNILIDYLNGVEDAAIELERYTELVISRVTWLEVLVGTRSAEEEKETRLFLSRFTLQELTSSVAERALTLRRDRRLRLPDAIILATAHEHGCLLLTRNNRDFHTDWPEIRIPYQL